MSRRPSVTQADLTRIIKGALAAGLVIGRLEVNPVTGIVTIVNGPVPDDDAPVAARQ
jgi:hypothetical protein